MVADVVQVHLNEHGTLTLSHPGKYTYVGYADFWNELKLAGDGNHPKPFYRTLAGMLRVGRRLGMKIKEYERK